MIKLELYIQAQKAIDWKWERLSRSSNLTKEQFDCWGLESLVRAVEKYDESRKTTIEDWVFQYVIASLGWKLRDEIDRKADEVIYNYSETDEDNVQGLDNMPDEDLLTMEELMDIKFAIDDNKEVFAKTIETGKTGSSGSSIDKDLYRRYHGKYLIRR